MVHLIAPGLDVIGAGGPGQPGIIQGHADRFAFGRTNFHIDQTDLFILRTKEGDPDRYWHKGAWKPFEIFEDEIAVKGAPAAALLRRWDCGIEADSAAALLFEMVMLALSSDFRDGIVPEGAKDLIPSVNLSEMLRILAAPDRRLGDDPMAARDAMIDRALVARWNRAVVLGGPDPKRWKWGDFHRVTIAHPLASNPAIAAAFPRIEGGRSGGDGTTPMARGFNARRGSMYRMARASCSSPTSAPGTTAGSCCCPASRPTRARRATATFIPNGSRATCSRFG